MTFCLRKCLCLLPPPPHTHTNTHTLPDLTREERAWLVPLWPRLLKRPAILFFPYFLIRDVLEWRGWGGGCERCESNWPRNPTRPFTIPYFPSPKEKLQQTLYLKTHINMLIFRETNTLLVRNLYRLRNTYKRAFCSKN